MKNFHTDDSLLDSKWQNLAARGNLAPEIYADLHYSISCSRLSVLTVHFVIITPYIFSRNVGSYKIYCHLTSHLET